MTRRLYLDNAATSFPKPRAVTDAMVDYATHVGASAGRGAYAEARASGKVLDDCREALCTMLNAPSPRHVIFTLNCTDALNLAIKGLIDPRGTAQTQHAVCTRADHNSILRPLTALADAGVLALTCVDVDPRTQIVDPEDIRAACRSSTRLIAVTHASNVTGTLQPIAQIQRVARDRAVPLVVDAAQSIGHVPIDVRADAIDLLAAPGHKALLGPLGTGFLLIRPGLEKILKPLREGGTGSKSDQPRQPLDLPDRYESGSHNTIGLAGLLAGVRWLLDKGIDNLWREELHLIRTFIDNTQGLPGFRYFGPPGVRDRVGVFSVALEGIGPLELADALEQRYGILTRAGIHCAPYMHEALGTTPRGGTTRLSFGPFVSAQDVKYATDALAEIALERADRASRPSPLTPSP